MPKLVSNPIQNDVDLGPMHLQHPGCLRPPPPPVDVSSDEYWLSLCLSRAFLCRVLPSPPPPLVLLLLLAVMPTFSGLLASNCFPFTMDDLSLAQSNNTCPVLKDDECGGGGGGYEEALMLEEEDADDVIVFDRLPCVCEGMCVLG